MLSKHLQQNKPGGRNVRVLIWRKRAKHKHAHPYSKWRQKCIPTSASAIAIEVLLVFRTEKNCEVDDKYHMCKQNVCICILNFRLHFSTPLSRTASYCWNCKVRGKITWQWLADHDAEINQVSIYGSRSRLCLEKHYHFIFNM